VLRCAVICGAVMLQSMVWRGAVFSSCHLPLWLHAAASAGGYEAPDCLLCLVLFTLLLLCRRRCCRG
jgi:hypothetical protein